MTAIEFTLNGTPVATDVRDDETLLDVLRERLGLTSMKDGCAPEGSCGACTVMVDGKAVVSCAQKATHVRGKEVTTLDGLTRTRRDEWAHAFVSSGASQCGFCSPGIVMKAEALLNKNPSPTRDEVARGLAGNLCRCTGYVKIIDAVELAAAARRGEPLPALDVTGLVGTRTPRYQGLELALGDKPYVNDMAEPGMLHGAVRFSDHPRARVLSIDTSKAEALPGVVVVVTAADAPGRLYQGDIFPDWPQFVAVGEVTRYVGDVLAAVAAEDRHTARQAAELVEVEYEVLDPVTDPFAAMDPDAPILHPEGQGAFVHDRNVLSLSTVKRGDADAALASAAHVVHETFRTQFIEHAFLEPESSLAVPERDGGFHVYSQGQGVWHDREQVASFMDLPEEKVRVTQVSNGGAFGAKEDLNTQCHATLLARRTGRPVKVTLSRKESLRFHSKRHPLTMEYWAGCDEDGRLVAVKARIVGDTGAYASVGNAVLQRATGHSCSVYKVDNVDVEGRAVYTNNPPCGAMRGFGSNQANFAMEGCLDRLAEMAGLDGWEIRWRNAVEAGDRFGTGQILGPGVGVKRTLQAVKPIWDEAEAAGRAVGIACAAKNTGVGNGLPEWGKAVIRAEADGSVTVFHSWTEMGQGVNTVMQQVACQELGLPPQCVRVVVDTSHEIDGGQTTASRGTVLGGVGIIDAAKKLKAALNGGRIADLAGREFPGEVHMPKTYEPQNGPDGGPTHFAYGWATQMAILDGEGRIERFVAAHDVGKAMNPTLLEGQIEGAVHMGLGHALSEEFVVEDGVVKTDTLKSLNIIPPMGMPPVEVILVEEPQPEGPYGAKGVGEIALVPTASAVAGALHAFDGRWRNRLPMKDSPAARAAVPKLARA
ncbi:MAG TPA: selenium-dependent xanthine dehydrogenase [Actinomycetota bacterium]